jgi:hypothetical protein
MAVLQMLPEVVSAVELLAAVALSKLVRFLEVPYPILPVLVCDRATRPIRQEPPRPGVLFAAVAACICLARPIGTLVKRTVIA